MKFKKIFGNKRIVGLAGEKNSGKTNNLISLIVDFREKNKDTPIYAYGLPPSMSKFLKKLDVKEISSLRHLIRKQNCVLIIDEFQKLKLNDRRFKDALNMFVDFVFHNNVYVILCSPNLREFNSIIGGVIERWILKNVRKDLCVNGSQLKKIIEEYSGKYKSLDTITLPLDKLLLINDDEEVVIDCPYIREADTKLSNEELF